MLNDKTVLITGGTGSFGNQVLERILELYTPRKVIIYSRDELKQHEMRTRLHSPIVDFWIGDVRDRQSVLSVMKNVDYVFHAAALKQVPSCEFFPMEAVMTNVVGTHNVLDAAEEQGVRKVVVLSTDKAVYPINAMGLTKALVEKLMLAKARTSISSTVFCGVRYGNVMYSRGSVLPLFVNQIRNHQPVTLTSADMTRFLLPLPTAIDLVFFALENGKNGDILVRKSPAATMGVLAAALIEVLKSKSGTKIIGISEGEKLHETLVTKEDLLRSESFPEYFRIKNLENLDYEKYFTEGKINNLPKEDYTSQNARRLDIGEVKDLLLGLREIQEQL